MNTCMKVLCIEGQSVGAPAFDADNNPVEPCTAEEAIYEGEYYTVAREKRFNDGVYYVLEERPIYSVYNSRRFSPVSDIDETEMIREYKTELV